MDKLIVCLYSNYINDNGWNRKILGFKGGKSGL